MAKSISCSGLQIMPNTEIRDYRVALLPIAVLYSSQDNLVHMSWAAQNTR